MGAKKKKQSVLFSSPASKFFPLFLSLGSRRAKINAGMLLPDIPPPAKKKKKCACKRDKRGEKKQG